MCFFFPTSYHGLLFGVMPLQVEKLVRPFDGTGDLAAWLRKFKMVAKYEASTTFDAINQVSVDFIVGFAQEEKTRIRS